MSCTINNLIGHRFNRWKVHSLAYIGKKHGTFWNCFCDCGSFAVVNGNSMAKGTSKSCGCIKNLKKGEAAFHALVKAYKNSAKRRNHKFKLKSEECRILFLAKCYYCGSHPKQIRQNPLGNGNFIYNGID